MSHKEQINITIAQCKKDMNKENVSTSLCNLINPGQRQFGLRTELQSRKQLPTTKSNFSNSNPFFRFPGNHKGNPDPKTICIQISFLLLPVSLTLVPVQSPSIHNSPKLLSTHHSPLSVCPHYFLYRFSMHMNFTSPVAEKKKNSSL